MVRVRDDERERRLYELEQALKREPDKAARRELTREYLDLTDPEKEPDL